MDEKTKLENRQKEIESDMTIFAELISGKEKKVEDNVLKPEPLEKKKPIKMIPASKKKIESKKKKLPPMDYLEYEEYYYLEDKYS